MSGEWKDPLDRDRPLPSAQYFGRDKPKQKRKEVEW